MKSKKTVGIIVGIVVVVAALGLVAVKGARRDFNAGGYVNAILDYTFKGKSEEAVNLFEEGALAHLENQYETNITTFVDKNITGGIEVDDGMRDKYIALCKDIFQAMKYQVKGVEKVNGDEYKVTVGFQAADIFPVYRNAALQEAAKIMEKVENGEYQGESTEEINLQMKQDTINNDYELLGGAYENVQYGKEEEMIFTVKRGEDGVFAIDGASLSEFIRKILSLDEIRD